MNAVENYLIYLADVLGVKKIINPLANFSDDLVKKEFVLSGHEKQITKQDLTRIELLFVNHIESSQESIFEKKNNELFLKMFSAMKVENIPSLVVDCHIEDSKYVLQELIGLENLKAIVFLKSTPSLSHDLCAFGHMSFIETFSPHLLNVKLELKKQTWLDLQKIMRLFHAN